MNDVSVCPLRYSSDSFMIIAQDEHTCYTSLSAASPSFCTEKYERNESLILTA